MPDTGDCGVTGHPSSTSEQDDPSGSFDFVLHDGGEVGRVPSHLSHRMVRTGPDIEELDDVSNSVQNHESFSGIQLELNPTTFNEVSELRPETPTHIEQSSAGSDETPATSVEGIKRRPNSNKRLDLRQSLGIYGSLIVFGGALIVVGAWGFLLFLWFGGAHKPGDVPPPHFWRYLMLDNRVTQAITLTSLVLRLVASAQATVCTSLLASLVLETHHVPLSEVAWYSTLRGVNDGPFRLIQLTFLRRYHWKTALRRIESLLLTVTFLAALGINFTSTILLSDIAVSGVVHDPEMKDVNLVFDLSQKVFVPSTEFWSQRPRAYATFGEISPGSLMTNDLGISDTGLVRRVFFPLANISERTTTSRYSGAAWVMSMRTTCMPPILQGSIFAETVGGGGLDSGFGALSGNISYSAILGRAGLSGTPMCDEQRCLPTKFDCAMPGAAGYEEEILAGREWVYSFCFLPSILKITDPDGLEPPTWDINDTPVSASSSVHIVLATNVPSSYWKRLGNETFPTNGVEENGEWISYNLRNGLGVNASLCFSAVNVTIAQVKLQAPGPIAEPVISFDNVTRQWDSSTVRVQLGANESVQDFARRGIFYVESIQDILPEESRDRSQPFNLSVAESSASVLQNAVGHDTFGLLDDTDHTVNFCDICTKYGTGADREISTLVGDVLRSTQRAATGILTIWSVLGQTYFYDILNLFGVSAEATIVTTTNVPVPLRRSGLLAVSIILAIHLATLLITTTMKYHLLPGILNIIQSIY
ncbi:hypothetical protein F5Y08DRAFT_351982 [Xylaria arbuscula]|nr:hypothetical protein F5Y08DRAFT_351982 [Xylaria arbuscula]